MMRSPRWTHAVALALACQAVVVRAAPEAPNAPVPQVVPLASAVGLVDIWQAAMRHDKTLAMADAAHAAAQPRRDQAAAL